tara:strand:+ start:987 stop:1343 length:357 start_codon:yes stop_codon:yes gene_type:complete
MSSIKVKKEPKKKKIINKKPKIEHYDPTFNDSQPIKWNQHDIYDVYSIYDLFFNFTDNTLDLHLKKDRLYWKDMINSIKEKENTGIIDEQITNITLKEKEKSVMKLFFKMVNELNNAD